VQLTCGQRLRRHGWGDGSSHLYTRAATSGCILVPRLRAALQSATPASADAPPDCHRGTIVPAVHAHSGPHLPPASTGQHRPAPACPGLPRPASSQQPPTEGTSAGVLSPAAPPTGAHAPPESMHRKPGLKRSPSPPAPAPTPHPLAVRGTLGAHARSLRRPLPAPRTNASDQRLAPTTPHPDCRRAATPSLPPCYSSTRNTTQGGVGGSFRVGGFKPPSWLPA